MIEIITYNENAYYLNNFSAYSLRSDISNILKQWMDDNIKNFWTYAIEIVTNADSGVLDWTLWKWRTHGIIVCFEKEEDAILFKLVWGNISLTNI